LLRSAPGPLALRNDRTGLLVATVLELAADSTARNRGLLGRDSLATGHALILAPSNFVHTFFMRFPIDILFVSRDGRVLKARHEVPARRIAGSVRAFAVIELAAGRLHDCSTVVGDRLSVVAA
jgi:uncharacterized membrane protein (UPF0127 family)